MPKRPIVLSVKRELWRPLDEDAVPADEAFKATRAEALTRDDYTCQFCDWRSTEQQDVHHFNDCHSDNHVDNLITACKLCHACHHIGFACQKGAGTLIWLPEVSQAQLNNLVRMFFVINEIGSDAQKAFAKDTWRRLRERADTVKAVWGTSSPVRFGNKLLIIPQGRYDLRGQFMGPLRLLLSPGSPMVGPAISSWVKQFAKLPPETWDSITSTVMDRLDDAHERARNSIQIQNHDIDQQMMEQERA